MSASTPIARLKQKWSTPADIVELLPPPEWGWGGTALIDGKDKATIAELLRRGYTKVEREDQP